MIVWRARCRCLTSRELLKHHQKCVNQSCPVCTPVKQYVQKQRMVMQRQQQEAMARKEAEARVYPHMMQVLTAHIPSNDPASIWLSSLVMWALPLLEHRKSWKYFLLGIKSFQGYSV